MDNVEVRRSEVGASWFADADHLVWVTWLDPSEPSNAGFAGLGSLRFRIRDPRVTGGSTDTDAGYAADFERADTLARAALAGHDWHVIRTRAADSSVAHQQLAAPSTARRVR